MAWIKKNQSSPHKRHTGQETASCGQPFRDYSNMKVLVFNKSISKLPVRTFLPCGRKKGLFGHIVAKSRKAWQTMELYPTEISEVHQTYPGHMKFIWACRECLGHPISKKNELKISFFGWVIPRTSFWLQIDYKVDWLIDYTNDYKLMELPMTKADYKFIDYRWLQADYKLLIDYKWLQVDWPQIDCICRLTTNGLQVDYRLCMAKKLARLTADDYKMATGWL